MKERRNKTRGGGQRRKPERDKWKENKSQIQGDKYKAKEKFRL